MIEHQFSNPSIELIEENVFANTQSFLQRLARISETPIDKEADVLAVKAALNQLTTDMQAFSHSLTEGPRSGISLLGPVLGTGIDLSQGSCSPAA
jgi:hypothetical protein